MRHIIKGPEPEAFVRWKNDNHGLDVVWEDLAPDAKRALRDALLEEQGYICCYCGRRIEADDAEQLPHGGQCEEEKKAPIIEHLRPRSQFPELTFDYHNLLACCLGGQGTKPRRLLHCDTKKGDWYDDELMVSPLNPCCDYCFVFRPDGMIGPTQDPLKKHAAEETIERLGLAIDKLRAARKVALDTAFDEMFAKPESKWNDYIQSLCEPDADGRLAPFCFALVQVLKRYA
jgi:uncharacterized protein (TIGR02646 family)